MAIYSSFEAQPVEILDQIFEYLPDHSDLLALSFASPNLADVLIPRYLPVCCIDVQNIPLLQKLSFSPLRRQIVSLVLVSKADTAQILICGGEPVPSLPDTIVVGNADVDGTLPALLRGMTCLRAFHWNVTGISPSTDVLAALQFRTPPLESVKIHSLRLRGNNDVPDKWFFRDSPLWKLSNLTSFSYALLQMLANCPMLEELELLLAHDRPADLRALFEGRWPQLKSLIIGGLEISHSVTVPRSSASDVQDFFSAHPALERLYLGINLDMIPLSYRRDTLDQSQFFGITSLPSLKLLHVPQNIFAMISPSAHMPHLQHLRHCETEKSYLPRFQELTQNALNITSIWLGLHYGLTRPGFKVFLECLPRLEKLYLTNGPPNPWVPIVTIPHGYDHGPRALAYGASVSFDGPDHAQNPLAEVCDALSVLPCLTHLPRFVIFHAHEAVDALVDPVVRRLAQVLPRLTFLELIVTGSHPPPADTQDVLVQGSNWLTIQRNAVGVCTGWIVIADVEAEAQQLGLDYTTWGSLNWVLAEDDPDDDSDFF